jgi:hypothetical protein
MWKKLFVNIMELKFQKETIKNSEQNLKQFWSGYLMDISFEMLT